MSNMLGRTKPWDPRTGCCRKHGGPENMTPKRMKEEREWRKEVAKEVEPDRHTGRPC